jgi:hypothetical protein
MKILPELNQTGLTRLTGLGKRHLDRRNMRDMKGKSHVIHVSPVHLGSLSQCR